MSFFNRTLPPSNEPTWKIGCPNCKKLEAERDRYKEALEKISKEFCQALALDETKAPTIGKDHCPHHIAKQALEGK